MKKPSTKGSPNKKPAPKPIKKPISLKMKSRPFKVDFCENVMDVITGVEGVVIGRCQYPWGNNEYLIQPREEVEAKWISEKRLGRIKVDENDIRPLPIIKK
jgi:hypothetical protein